MCHKRLREASKSDRAPQDRALQPRRGKPQSTPQSAHLLQDDEAPQVVHTDPDVYTLKVKSGKVAPLITTVEVNGTDLAMEVDTGASLSLISEETYRSHWPADTAPVLEPSSISVRTYSGEELRVLGSLTVSVRYKEQEHRFTLVVICVSGPSLLGRDWLSSLRLDWRELHLLKSSTVMKPLEEILEWHAAVFKDELGTIAGVTAKILVDPTVQPRFCKPRPNSYALRAHVEAEL